MESRALGRYPTQSSRGVWSEVAWAAAIAPRPWTPPGDVLPEIGCDVARGGLDWTAIHIRWGTRSVHHERHNGWTTDKTAARLRQLADEWAGRATAVRQASAAPIRPQDIVVKVDGDGLGVGVLDQSHGYRFVPVCASSAPIRSSEFSNRRPELWFTVYRLATMGRLDLSGLDRDTLQRLRQQAMSPQWEVRNGLIWVEPKEVTKARLGASPDCMDAVNIAYARSGIAGVAQFIDEEKPEGVAPKAVSRGVPHRVQERKRGGLFGRR